MQDDFKGRIAWVVGAGGTLGRQISLDLAAAGATVYISSRAADKLEAMARETSGLHPLPLDITERKSVDAAAARIVERSGRIDILVNSTSLSLFGDFLTLDDDVWERVLQTKQIGYVRTIRAALPHMLRQKQGVVVCVSGKGGRAPRDVHLPGCSANAAVNLLTRGLAMTYGKDGVRFVAVAPGVIESPRLAALSRSAADRNRFDGAQEEKAIAGSNYLGRRGTAQDIANAVLFAASDRAGFMTGTAMDVDGG